MRLRVTTAAIVAALTAIIAAPVAGAANQRGLVNVDVSNLTVQIPVGIAANVCDVSANVLAQATQTSPAQCTAVSNATAFSTGTGGGGGTNQQGLVNIAITNDTIQVPVGIAANLCDIAVNILAQNVSTGTARCTAVASPSATG